MQKLLTNPIDKVSRVWLTQIINVNVCGLQYGMFVASNMWFAQWKMLVVCNWNKQEVQLEQITKYNFCNKTRRFQR